MVHELKCYPQFFEAVWSGDKLFEVRKNDRDFKVGDSLLLVEWWTPSSEGVVMPVEGHRRACKYTGRGIVAEIIYVLPYKDFSQALQEGYCVLGLGSFRRYRKESP